MTLSFSRVVSANSLVSRYGMFSKLIQDCCSYLEDDVRVVDAVHADARDDVGEEEGQPADDEHPHHRPQSLGSLLLLRELGHLAREDRDTKLQITI